MSTILGTLQSDSIVGTSDDDFIFGFGGADTLAGGVVSDFDAADVSCA